jgi:hypothetical protein
MKNIVMTILFGLVSLMTFGQSDVYISLLPANSDTIDYTVADTLENPLAASAGSFQTNVVIELADILNVGFIDIQAGRSSGGVDLVSHSFTFDDASPGGGYSYLREQSIVTVGLGVHSNVLDHFVTVTIKDASNNVIETLNYSSL